MSDSESESERLFTSSLLAGCIKWLPPKEKLSAKYGDLDDGCYNHPVVILSNYAQDGNVVVLFITSFNNSGSLETKWTQASLRHHYLPVVPSSPHPDNGILLDIQGGRHTLRKPCWVNTRSLRSVPLAALQPYSRREPDYYLSWKSYKILIHHVKYIDSSEPPPPNSSATILIFAFVALVAAFVLVRKNQAPPPPPKGFLRKLFS
ncbi:hypothetical protein F5Y16DRAFT_364734 [Xylariaceae sp. FL0255]|nr:hypothetical protein F5Y16DRAFT_364734 [Xylariaceae sp. FL0255]